jgi:riboflavin kinase/FMN adenylyltransferase
LPAERAVAIESLGADTLLLIHFDRAFSGQSGEAFIRGLARDLGKIQSICVGADFVFGCQRSGNVALLKKLGDELGFTVHGLAAVSLDNQIVSSTRIREAIRSGNLDAASQMLGRPYAISGRVIAGDGVGRKLGFPTANLDAIGLVLPPNGVYLGLAKIEKKSQPVALNIGVRPTLATGGPQLRVEAHLLDFSGDLYGRELEIEIGEKLRDERKFGSLEELKAQIARDVAGARRRF